MKADKKSVTDSGGLSRKEAEKYASQSSAAEAFSIDLDAKRLLQELQVHQVKMQMQNEELFRVQTLLRQSEARYMRIIEGITDYLYTVRIENGRVVETIQTPACEKVTGYTPEEFAADPYLWIRMVEPEDRDLVNRQVENILRGVDTPPIEHRIIRKDGALRWVTDTIIPFKDASGTLLSYDGVIKDITEQRQIDNVQTFLAQTSRGMLDEPFFQTLARYLAKTLDMDFVCIDRLEGNGLTARTLAVWCDGQFEDNVTYALEDTPCGEVVNKSVCCFPANVCQFFPRDEVLQELRAESYVGVTLFSHEGRPIGLIAVIGRRPLTNRTLAETTIKLVATRTAAELERLEVEETLKESEENHRTLFSEMLDGFALHEIICDAQGNPVDYRFLAVNPAFERLTGLKAKEILNRTVRDVLPKMEQDWIDKYGKVALTGEPASFQSYSSELDKHFEVKAYRPAPGQFACIFEDITERKLAEEGLLESIDEMQRFHYLTVERELNMIELKKEINDLLKKSGQEEKYWIAD